VRGALSVSAFQFSAVAALCDIDRGFDREQRCVDGICADPLSRIIRFGLSAKQSARCQSVPSSYPEGIIESRENFLWKRNSGIIRKMRRNHRNIAIIPRVNFYFEFARRSNNLRCNKIPEESGGIKFEINRCLSRIERDVNSISSMMDHRGNHDGTRFVFAPRYLSVKVVICFALAKHCLSRLGKDLFFLCFSRIPQTRRFTS